MPSQHDRQHQLVSPVLRLVLCFTSLIDITESADGVCTSFHFHELTAILSFSSLSAVLLLWRNRLLSNSFNARIDTEVVFQALNC